MCWMCAVRRTHTHISWVYVVNNGGNRVLFKVFVPVPTTRRTPAAAPHPSWPAVGVVRGSVSFYFVFKLPAVFQWVSNLDSQRFFRRLLAIWASFLMKLGSVKVVRSSAHFSLVLCITNTSCPLWFSWWTEVPRCNIAELIHLFSVVSAFCILLRKTTGTSRSWRCFLRHLQMLYYLAFHI